jgi:hypothetical protein
VAHRGDQGQRQSKCCFRIICLRHILYLSFRAVRGISAVLADSIPEIPRTARNDNFTRHRSIKIENALSHPCLSAESAGKSIGLHSYFLGEQGAV